MGVSTRRSAWMELNHRELVEAAQSILEISDEQLLPLGTRIALRDGRVFHYAKAGAAALSPGKLVGSPCTPVQEETLTVAVAAGSTTVTFSNGTGSDISADTYNEGWLVVNDGTGVGQMFKIKDHPAITNGSTGLITLYDQVVTALDTTSDIMLVPNIFSSVTLNPDQVRKTIGVPLVSVTANYYFWCQTWGPATVLCGDSLGNAATERWCHSTGAAGAFVSTAGGVGGTEVIGVQLLDSTDGVSSEYYPIYLECIP